MAEFVRHATFLLAGLLLFSGLAGAEQQITGTVVDVETGAPVPDARVHAQALADAAVVVTNQQGRFALSVDPDAANVAVAAAVEYDPDAAAHYTTAVVTAAPGDDISIALSPIPALDNLEYQPVPAIACAGCHPDQYAQWQDSNHSRAAVNVRVRDLYSGDGTASPTSAEGWVYTALHDADDSGFCATCHAPNERPSDPGAVKFNEVATDPGLDGVTCTSCHQLHRITDDHRAIHLLGNAEFRFPLAFRANDDATHEHVWGPLDDVGFERMRAAYAPVFSTSKLCASCHQYDNPDTGAPGQETYSEWLDSPARDAGVQCQDCHMPAADSDGKIAMPPVAPVRPAEQRHHHGFPGVYSGLLPDPIELAFDVDVLAGAVTVRTRVQSRVTGHNWPTGVDFRNAMLVVEAFLDGQPLTQIAGARLPDWASDAEPGVQPGDFGARAGHGYAKVLEGAINGDGPRVSPVSFIDADTVLANTTLPPGATDQGRFTFELPRGASVGDDLDVRARVVYRRVWREIAVTKGWTELAFEEPWQRTVADTTLARPLRATDLERLFISGFEP